MEKGQGKGTDTLPTDNVFTRKEYIERDAAIDAAIEAHNIIDNNPCQNIRDCIGAIPAADVVPVVRCGECEHYKKRYWANGRCYGTFCDIWNRDHGKTFFCERGIKREKAERAERRERRCMRNWLSG